MCKKYVMCKCMHINDAENYKNGVLRCEKCKKTLSRKVGNERKDTTS